MSGIKRRQLLRGASAFGTALMGPGLPVWSWAQDFPIFTVPVNFINASSALTGLPAQGALDPAISQDNVSLSEIYYAFLNAGFGASVVDLGAAYDAYKAQGYTDAEIGDLLLKTNGAVRTDIVGSEARLTMLMWMFGIWYGGTETTNVPAAKGNILPGYQMDFVISAKTYKAGWIWRYAQAHPMGYSHFNFGSWADAPPQLGYFIGMT